MTTPPPTEYPVEIDIPDIEPYLAGNTGIRGSPASIQARPGRM